MAGKEKMTSVASTSRRPSVSGAAGGRRTPGFEFTVPRQPRQRVSSERSSRSSTPVRSSRGSSPVVETRRRPPSRCSTPQPSSPASAKKKRNNELEQLLISAANDGQRRSDRAGPPVKKRVPTGAKKALEKAKRGRPPKSQSPVKSPIKKAKAKLVVKKKVVGQLKKATGAPKKTETKAKPKGSKKDEPVILPESLKLPDDTPKSPVQPEETPKEEEQKKAPVVPPKVLEVPAKVPEVPSNVLEVAKSESTASVDPFQDLRDAIKESLKTRNDPLKPSEEPGKELDSAVRREEKPKVDVMQTLTEACRKLEQLTGKKKEAPVPDVAPRSPEGAAMTTADRLIEKTLQNSVISPVNLQAKLRNKLSQSPSTDAKEGTMALTLPTIPPLMPAPIINSLSAAAKQTSSFLKDAEAPIEWRSELWRSNKRLSMLAPLNACIKGKVADLLRKNPDEVVLKENKRKEPEAEEEMEELRLSESESESTATSPDKTLVPKVVPDVAVTPKQADKPEAEESKPEPPEEVLAEKLPEEPEESEKEQELLVKEQEPLVEEASPEPEMPKKKVAEPVVEEAPEEKVVEPEVEAVPEEKPEEPAVEEAPEKVEEEIAPETTTPETDKQQQEIETAKPAVVDAPKAAETKPRRKGKFSRIRKERERKKQKRDAYRLRKLQAAEKAATPLPEVEAKKKVEPVVVLVPLAAPSPPPSTSPTVGETSATSSPESREEDLTAKESVLGALGLQATRLVQQERPKVPKLKLVVRPTPAKKKGHRSENGSEKTYAICHEGDGDEGQKNSHRKKSLWYPGLPISNGELAKLIQTTPTISDLIIGRHLGEAKPPQPGIGVGDGLDTEAELGHKGGKKKEEVVIPEKTAASNVHPGRECEDVCCYCHNKFGLFDTPLHVSQLKGGHDKQAAVLAREPVLTLASCVCDACFRHLDRPLASVAAWRPPQSKSKKQREAATCCFAGCSRPAPHPLVKKWKRRVRGLLARGLDPKSGMFLCQQHHQETAKIGACVLCGRRAASSQLYCLDLQAADPFNEVLRQDLIPIVVKPEADLCKKCRYYSSLRLRCADYTRLSVSNRAFLRAHREKIIKSVCPTNPAALIEVFPEVASKPVKKPMLPPLPPPRPMSPPLAPKRTLLTPSVEIIPVPADGPAPPKKARGPPLPAKEAVTVRLVGAAPSPAPAPPKRPLVKRTARNDGPNLQFQWHGETGPPRGRWHDTRADIQMDDRTLAEWKRRQEPFGSYTSYVKHLVMLDGFWRAKQLGPLPGASGACTKYCTSVRNRIEAYEGRGEEPEELGQPRICDVRSLAQ